MILSPVLRQRYLDSNGNPLAGGKLHSYVAGTTTPLATYSNQSGTTNTNPVILDANGEANVWLDPTLAYKFVLKDSSDVTQWTVDSVTNASSVGTSSIADGAVSTAKLADDSVDATKLKDDAVTDVNRAVTSNHIRDSAVTGAKLATSAADASTLEVSAGSMRIKDGGVTQVKLASRATGSTVAAGGVAVSSSCGSYTFSSTSFANVTNLSVTITTTGRPVQVMLTSAGTTTIGGVIQSQTADFIILKITRDSTLVYQTSVGGPSQIEVPSSSVVFVDVVAAGTHTYTVAAKSQSGGTMYIGESVLVAFEI